jgi:hypothetical protein
MPLSKRVTNLLSWKKVLLGVVLLAAPLYYSLGAILSFNDGTIMRGLEFFRYAWVPPYFVALWLVFSRTQIARVVAIVVLLLFSLWAVTGALYP